MKKMFLALGTAALLALGALSSPAQAQPFPAGRPDRPGVIVVQPPPPHRVVRPHHGPRYDHRYHHRHDRRFQRRMHRQHHYRNHGPRY
jgi:hypothetical protein